MRFVGPHRASRIFQSVPYPSWVREYRPKRDHASLPPWAHRHARPTLIAAAFSSTRFGNTSYVGRLRRALATMCERAPTGACVLLTKRADETALGYEARVASAYWQSTYCLQPSGDSLMRKGVVDSLLLGCIPVLFSPAQREVWPWHWGDWVVNATVLLTSRQWDFTRQLSALPPANLEQLQDTIARFGHRMWHATSAADAAAVRAQHGGPGDAFEVSLEAVYHRSIDPDLQAVGHNLQRIQGAAHRVAIDEFGDLERRSVEGMCLGQTSGSWSAASCALPPRTSASTAWVPPRPHIAIAHSPSECIERCRGCSRCGVVAFSLSMRLCVWSAYDALSCKSTPLERRWEYWTFRSFTVRTQHGELLPDADNISTSPLPHATSERTVTQPGGRRLGRAPRPRRPARSAEVPQAVRADLSDAGGLRLVARHCAHGTGSVGILLTNFAMASLVFNFHVQWQRVSPHPPLLLVPGADGRECARVTRPWTALQAAAPPCSWASGVAAHPGWARYGVNGSTHVLALYAARWYAASRLTARGLSVMILDVDAALLTDLWSLLRAPPLADYDVIMTDQGRGSGINCGFVRVIISP